MTEEGAQIRYPADHRVAKCCSKQACSKVKGFECLF